jgi:hypothetical protein
VDQRHCIGTAFPHHIDSQFIVPSAVWMVFAHPPYPKTNRTVLIHLKAVGCSQRGGFILIAQLLLGKMIKFLVTAVRLSRLLPELVSATDNVHSGRLWHFPRALKNPRPTKGKVERDHTVERREGFRDFTPFNGLHNPSFLKMNPTPHKMGSRVRNPTDKNQSRTILPYADS